jgi:hypothetical protein
MYFLSSSENINSRTEAEKLGEALHEADNFIGQVGEFVGTVNKLKYGIYRSL